MFQQLKNTATVIQYQNNRKLFFYVTISSGVCCSRFFFFEPQLCVCVCVFQSFEPFECNFINCCLHFVFPLLHTLPLLCNPLRHASCISLSALFLRVPEAQLLQFGSHFCCCCFAFLLILAAFHIPSSIRGSAVAAAFNIWSVIFQTPYRLHLIRIRFCYCLLVCVFFHASDFISLCEPPLIFVCFWAQSK